MLQTDDLVKISEAHLAEFLAAFPTLQRLDIMGAIVRAGPFRERVVRELHRLHRERLAKVPPQAHPGPAD